MRQPGILATATVTAAEGVLTSPFDDEVVLLNLADGVYYGLDTVGARVWTLIQRPVTVEAIQDTLLREYDVERPRCESDLGVLLSELVGRGLVVVREG